MERRWREVGDGSEEMVGRRLGGGEEGEAGRGVGGRACSRMRWRGRLGGGKRRLTL